MAARGQAKCVFPTAFPFRWRCFGFDPDKFLLHLP